MKWQQICAYESLSPEYGVPALLGEHPVALFRTGDGELFAVGNVDPYCGAGVISRGIVGDREGEPTVASPMLKQVFSLRTGECLDDPGTRLPTFAVRRKDDVVEIGLP
ncbi:nitrite reductase small subunit NirD [Saccharopolyspora erythraea]|uniref:nitrite reductase small subunit NirD n=1 Tax=Saccharopolyspora erythraea TaxID=1836 RepID=UPI001BAB5B45|nr:nitrite reductase small subunit NirD [Saccharopolyspora erythraea]QUH02773.1 nitrite reductase small subunit NirD [Saccharopolyspora erythraea]